MSILQQLAQGERRWPLEEFVDVANQLLPQYLPQQEPDSRMQDAVNPRLVRHYATQGLLDKPYKQGREARYAYRHLLQLLLLKKLLAAGYSVGSLTNLTLNKPDGELEALLLGGAKLTVETANPALAFLSQVRQRSTSALPAAPASSDRASAAAPTPAGRAVFTEASPSPTQWARIDLLPGLELHVRQDFAVPTSPQERDALLQLIAQRLTDLHFS
ncbi:MerR family transcriptional regulator [Pseudanabaena sp. FACHB-2040]|uniref:MerR family transcriptional regulator n=1 Tax=Pseudanabaena sp. FACHB-2040 TaxID=2692859 RepID=UPI001687AF48|nr:MerR family transcriptional regulator [Pseudanabaena sp. FACHB-2040]MBD2259413.1 MerR family transcriptional regulator [Pseudanabaena sp. FACHB-2040]